MCVWWREIASKGELQLNVVYTHALEGVCLYIYTYTYICVNVCVVKGDCLQRGVAALYGLHTYVRGSLPVHIYVYIIYIYIFVCVYIQMCLNREIVFNGELQENMVYTNNLRGVCLCEHI